MDHTPPTSPDDGPKLHVACPHCQSQMFVNANRGGSAASCPQCGGNFEVPLPTASGVAPGVAPAAAGATHVDPNVQAFAGKKIAAGICGILLGSLGIHKFILGLNSGGAIMLIVTIVGYVSGCLLIFPFFAAWAMGLIGLIEGIIYLTKTDAEFYDTYAVQQKQWF